MGPLAEVGSVRCMGRSHSTTCSNPMLPLDRDLCSRCYCCRHPQLDSAIASTRRPAPCEKRTSGAARARTIPFVGPRCHSFRPERPRLMQPFMFVATTLRNLILEAVPRCQSRREVGGPAPKLRLHQSARGERKTTATFGKRPTPASPSEKTALEKTGLGWKPLGMLLGCVTSETFGRSGEVQLLEGVGGRFRS